MSSRETDDRETGNHVKKNAKLKDCSKKKNRTDWSEWQDQSFVYRSSDQTKASSAATHKSQDSSHGNSSSRDSNKDHSFLYSHSQTPEANKGNGLPSRRRSYSRWSRVSDSHDDHLSSHYHSKKSGAKQQSSPRLMPTDSVVDESFGHHVSAEESSSTPALISSDKPSTNNDPYSLVDFELPDRKRALLNLYISQESEEDLIKNSVQEVGEIDSQHIEIPSSKPSTLMKGRNQDQNYDILPSQPVNESHLAIQNQNDTSQAPNASMSSTDFPRDAINLKSIVEVDSDAETIISDSTPSSKLSELFFRDSRNNIRKKRGLLVSDDDDDDDDKRVTLDKEISRKSPAGEFSLDSTLGPISNASRISHAQSLKKLTPEFESINKSEVKLAGEIENVNTKRVIKDYKIKRDSTGRSQLQKACKKGEIEKVKIFLARGADPNECDFGGFTCLHEAALAGHSNIVLLLIQKGAIVNKQALEAGDLETPLMDACENKHYETVKVLLRHGADPHICNVDGFSAFTKLQHLRTSDDSYKPILEILERYSNSKASETNQGTPLLSMAEDTSESYFGDLVKKKFNNVYRFAAQGNKEATAENFIAHALDLLSMPDILFLAARNGHVELVDILLGLNPKPFDINQKNAIGSTALHATIGRGYHEVVKFLLSRGADPTIHRGTDGKNALQIAKSFAQVDAIEDSLLQAAISGQQCESPLESNFTLSVDKEVSTDETLSFAATLDIHTREKHDIKLQQRRKTKSKAGASSEVSSIRSEKHCTALDAEIDEKEINSPLERNEMASQISQELFASNSKDLEKLRIRATEEAKVWQEKMLAKKRARKEMFLQAEKEKERRRKVDEQLKLEELKVQEKRLKDRILQEAMEAKKEALVAKQRRSVVELQFILLRYPIGLQDVILNGSSSQSNVAKCSPLYVFSIDNQDWVIDLQISLLICHSVSAIHDECREDLGEELDLESKSKVWPLFFNMIGITKSGYTEESGSKKFQDLSLRFLRLKAACNLIKKHNPDTFRLICEMGKASNVNLSTLERISVLPSSGLDLTCDERVLGFVPPKLRKRQDVAHTIFKASSSLW